MKKNIILIGVVTFIILINGCKPEDEFREIKECVIDTSTAYYSGTNVKDETDVLAVSNDFITWSKDNLNSPLMNTGSDWKIESIEPHGLYKNIKYWTVTYSYLENQRSGGSQFDVNENGNVVLFLGCI